MRSSAGFPSDSRPILWILCVVSIVAFSLWESHTRSDRIRMVSDQDWAYRGSTEPVAHSPTGYALGERHTVLPFRVDDMHWIMHTQELAAEGNWRLRHVVYDNAPEGREAHWSSAYSWWIRLLASIDRFAKGSSAPASIESAALYANLVLATFAMIIVVVFSARYFGDSSALICGFGFVGMIPFRDYFMYGVGDHHAAAIMCSALCVLFLILAVRDLDCEASDGANFLERRWLWIGSGVFGGVGLWINAVSLAPLLAVVQLVAAVAIWLGPKIAIERRAMDAFASGLRLWGRAGGAASVAAYAVEYAPSDFSMHLEVNHPLYALAWVGGGEILYRLCRIRTLDRRMVDRRDLLALAVSMLAVALLPILVVVARADVFQVGDPFLMAVHERYIMEFQSLWTNLEVVSSPLRKLAMCLPLAIPVLGLGVLCFGGLSAWRRVTLSLALVPALAYLALAFVQARWLGQACGLSIPLLALISYVSNKWIRYSMVAFLAPGALLVFVSALWQPELQRKEAIRVAERGLAHRLRERVGEKEAIVLAAPDATSALAYHAGIRGLGTFYWENNIGLKKAASIFAAPDFESAYERVKEVGVTHIALFSWGGFEKEYIDLYWDYLDESQRTDSPFLMRLLRDKSIPAWLRAIPYRMPEHPLLEGELAIVFEVVAPQSSEDRLARRFEYFLEMGWVDAARSLGDALEMAADHLPSQISLARLQGLSGREAEFRLTLDRVYALASESDEMDPEDRVRMISILAIGGYAEAAKDQLNLFWKHIDEGRVRLLSSETHLQLIKLERMFGSVDADGELLELCEHLLPPRLENALE